MSEVPSTTSAVWPRWLTGLVVLVALGTAVAVFVLPWFVPVRVLPVYSDSQAVGFNNRVAIVGLVLGALAMAVLAFMWNRSLPPASGESAPVVVLEGVAREERVSRWLVVTFSLLALAVAAVAIRVYREFPFGDATYFVDRLFYLANGSRLYADIEFMYGPIMVLPAFGLWLIVRAFGVGLVACYYTGVTLMHLTGFAMAAYLLNRLNMPHRWRNALFALIGVCALSGVPLLANYSPLRFLTPAVALLISLRLSQRSSWAGGAAAFLGVLFGASVSPEVGAVAAVGLMVAFVAEALTGDVRAWIGAVGALAGAAGSVAAYSLVGPVGQSTVAAAAASGTFYFPVLPGLPAVVFVATALLSGWGAGTVSGQSAMRSQRALLGWLAGALAFVTAAFGRADLVHIFWNGLPLILLTAALMWRAASREAVAFVAVAAVVFVVSVSVTELVTYVPGAFVSGVRSGAVSRSTSMSLARHLRRSSTTGVNWFKSSRLAEPDAADIEFLAGQGGVFDPYSLHGSASATLARRHALAPVYAAPQSAFTAQQIARTLGDLARARWVILPRGEYEVYLAQTASMTGVSGDGMVQSRGLTDPAFYSVLTGFPLAVSSINPSFDSRVPFGRALRAGWRPYRESGDFVILCRDSTGR